MSQPVAVSSRLPGLKPAGHDQSPVPTIAPRLTPSRHRHCGDAQLVCGAERADRDVLGPEHLEIQTADDDFFLKELRNYGSLFLGPWSTVAYSDKGIAGTNHVLPTGKTARYNAGLSVSRFLKPLTYQRAQQNATPALAPAVERISAFEGLAAHEATATLRIDKVGRHSGAFDGTPAVTRGQR
jgi:sulfopropanediol 3-dehydrogenase